MTIHHQGHAGSYGVGSLLPGVKPIENCRIQILFNEKSFRDNDQSINLDSLVLPSALDTFARFSNYYTGHGRLVSTNIIAIFKLLLTWNYLHFLAVYVQLLTMQRHVNSQNRNRQMSECNYVRNIAIDFHEIDYVMSEE